MRRQTGITFNYLLSLILALTTTSGCKFFGLKDQSRTQQAWDEVNSPLNILPNNKLLERRFDKLKMAAEAVRDVRFGLRAAF